MSMMCKLSGHKWNGCICSRCGEKRDEGHAWDGCTCNVCGKTRDAEHRFELVPKGHLEWDRQRERHILQPKHIFRCERCGKERFEEHEWTGEACQTVCRVCGGKAIMFGSYTREKMGISHRWSGNTCKDHCEICGEPYPAKHVYERIRSEEEHGSGKAYRTHTLYRCSICGHEYWDSYEHDN